MSTTDESARELRVPHERALALAQWYLSLNASGVAAHSAGNLIDAGKLYSQAESLRGTAMALLGDNTWDSLVILARNRILRP